MTQHTPGPWDVGPPIINHAQGQSDLTVRDKTGFIVCYVNQFAASFDDKKDHANARLIAAAPDLLRACEAVLLWTDYHCEANTPASLREALVNVIAKATGENLQKTP